MLKLNSYENSNAKNISKSTGYSVTTVSRALGSFDGVNAETRQAILNEALQQGYEPNLQARLSQGLYWQRVQQIVKR